MASDLGALVRYHRYRVGAFWGIGGFLLVMALIPALALPGPAWQRALLIAFGLALSSPFFLHALRKRGNEVGLFENAIVFRTRKTTKIVLWDNVKSFQEETLTARSGAQPSARAWLTTKSGDRLLVNGGPIGFENVDFLVAEIRRRIPPHAAR